MSERPDCNCEPGKCGASAAVALLGRRCKSPSTVDRDALLKQAVALLEKAEHVRMDGLPLISRCPECRSPRDLSQPHEVNCSYDAFLVSPSLAAWRRETGK